MTQRVDARVPILEPQPHVVNLLHVQHLGLHPVDPRHLCYLVDAPPQQPQTQRLHDENLNLLRLHARLAGDGLKRHGTVVGRPAENSLRERGERYLLPEKGLVLLEQGRAGDVCLEHGVGGQVAAVEGEEEVAQPGVLWALAQGVEDGVQEELAEVVDGVGDEGGDAEVVGAGVGLGGGELCDVDAGEVEEGVAVVGGEVLLGLVVAGVCAVEGGVYLGLDGVEGVEDRFGLVEVYSGGVVGAEAELDFGGGDEGVDVCVL